MAAVLIATAATLGKAHTGAALDTVQQIAQAITPFLGEGAGKLLFAMGMIGSALVATIVVTLTAARTMGEVLGVKHSLEHAPREAPWFYGIYTVSLVASGLFVVSGVNLISLSVGVQVMYAVIVALTITLTAGFGVYAALAGIGG